MPNRMLRDWTKSDPVNNISCEAERFFVRLIMKVDDYGCYYADHRLLKADLFPLKLDKIREADIPRWMDECQKAGLIVLYESSGKKFLQIADFRQRKRIMNRQFPPPTHDGHTTVTRPHEDEDEREEEKEDEEALQQVEKEKFTNNSFFEKFRRVAASHLTDKELIQEVGRFRNKYPNVHINQSGGLINAWVANIGKQEKQTNERAKNLKAAKDAIERQ